MAVLCASLKRYSKKGGEENRSRRCFTAANRFQRKQLKIRSGARSPRKKRGRARGKYRDTCENAVGQFDFLQATRLENVARPFLLPFPASDVLSAGNHKNSLKALSRWDLTALVPSTLFLFKCNLFQGKKPRELTICGFYHIHRYHRRT